MFMLTINDHYCLFLLSLSEEVLPINRTVLRPSLKLHKARLSPTCISLKTPAAQKRDTRIRNQETETTSDRVVCALEN